MSLLDFSRRFNVIRNYFSVSVSVLYARKTNIRLINANPVAYTSILKYVLAELSSTDAENVGVPLGTVVDVVGVVAELADTVLLTTTIVVGDALLQRVQVPFARGAEVVMPSPPSSTRLSPVGSSSVPRSISSLPSDAVP